MENVAIRELETSDYEALAIFNSAFPDDKRSKEEWLERFMYWWDQNPAYDENWVRGFLLLDNEKIVGFVGSFPTLFKAGNDIIKAFNGTTWRVLENYRRWSIDLWTKNREVSKDYLSFNTTPTKEVISLIKRYKYFLYPWGNEKASYVITQAKDFSKIFLPPSLNKINGITGIGINMLQILKQRLSKSSLIVKEIDPLKVDLNNLWENTKGTVEFTNVRDSCTVRWYAQNRKMLGVFDKEELIAYALFDLKKHSKYNFQIMIMVDLWYQKITGLKEILSVLIRYCNKYASKNMITYIEYPHFSKDLSYTCQSLGLNKKSNISTGYIRFANNQKYEMNNDNSYFTLVQGDYGV